MKHKDYKIEKERLDYTKDYLDITIKAIEEYKSNSFQSYMENMSEEDKTDNSSAYINMMLKSQTMDFAEKNYYNYKKALNKPYFARIDFTLEGEVKTQKLYIGKSSLMKAENNEMLIVDWRAPVASIYYDGKLGEVEYESEEGLEKGILSLKRQLSIEEGELKNILDIDITANDGFLQASLSANAENKLKDIASTIQAEQNKVIRAPLHKPIIIQGVAGSGKTTIALHRIAYFMYTYEKTFSAENFLILAPNNLFINYISEVLPELGVENVKQSTYIDFMKSLLGAKPRVISRDEVISQIIEKKEEIKEKVWLYRFKGSIEYVKMINSYLKSIEESFLPNEDFSVRGKLLMTREAIRKMFVEELSIYSFGRRIKEIEKSLKNKLSLVDKDIIKRVEFSCNLAIDMERKSKKNLDCKREKLIELMDIRDREIALVEKEVKNAVKDYIKKFKVKELNDYYREFLEEKNLKLYGKEFLDSEKIREFSEYSLKNFGDKKIELEDLAPLVYLKYKIFGFSKKINVKSVVIDEAQDFSVFEFYTLKTCLETSMFTILGDMSQGIYSYRAIENWDDVINNVFEGKNVSYMTLEQSYRTTIEVMELGNKIIKQLNDSKTVFAKPVIRHGEEPNFIEFENKENLIGNLEKDILNGIKEGYKSLAIICKTLKECKTVKKLLDKSGKVESMLLNDKNNIYEAGVIVLPSYLAKGLEFDNTFIVNLDEKYTQSILDIKLLYVAITRTLHKLSIYTLKDNISLIE